jgi:hypothetical protein
LIQKLSKTLAAPLASLLAAGALIATALLTATRLRLLSLPDIATVGFVFPLTDLAHVVAILNHVLAAEAVFVVSNLCHKNSSFTPPHPHWRT